MEIEKSFQILEIWEGGISLVSVLTPLVVEKGVNSG